MDNGYEQEEGVTTDTRSSLFQGSESPYLVINRGMGRDVYTWKQSGNTWHNAPCVAKACDASTRKAYPVEDHPAYPAGSQQRQTKPATPEQSGPKPHVLKYRVDNGSEATIMSRRKYTNEA